MLGEATYTVYRKGTVANVGGVAVPGTEITFSAVMSVQPFTPSDTMYLPDGLRTKQVCKAYSQTELRTVELHSSPADEVSYDGGRWVVHGLSQYGEGLGQVLWHWKYFLERVGEDEHGR